MRSMILLVALLLPNLVFAQVDVPPTPTREPAAIYPERALKDRVEASVLFELTIDATGQVVDVTLVQRSDLPDYGFEAAAEAALRDLPFSPALAGGQPVPVRIQYRYRFVLPPLPSTKEADDPSRPPPAVEQAKARGALSGVVLERGTRAPLPGVLVTLTRDDAAFETNADGEGRFTFVDLTPGPWLLEVEATGYGTSEGTESVAANEQTEVRVYLERTADNPYDVMVEASAPAREVSRRRLSAREVETQPGTFGDPLLAVENLPGVAVVPFAGGSIAMRGASTDESGIFLEGLRMPFFFHFIGVRSMIAPGMLESIDLYPGNAPPRFGRHVGGVLSVNLKQKPAARLSGYADVSLLDAGVFVEAPLSDKLSLAAAFRMSYLDKVMASTDAPIPRYDDYQFAINAQPDKGHNLRLFALGSDDAVELDTESLREDSAQITFGEIAAEVHMQHVAVEHEYVPSTRLQNRVRLGYLHFTFNTSSGDLLEAGARTHVLLARDTLRYRFASWFTAEVGLDAELGRYETEVTDLPTPKEGEPKGYVDLTAERRNLSGGFDYDGLGGFLALELSPVERLTIIPGLRVDRQPMIDEVTLDPRLSARFAVNEHLTLKVASGVYHASPASDEIVEGFGNPDIGVERALQHSVGLEVLPLPFLSLDATGFYHRLDELSVVSDRFRITDGEPLPLNYENTGEGRSYGLELMLRQQLAHRLSGWVAYTLARTERRRNEEEPLRRFDYDQTHTLAVVAAYQLPWHMQLSTRFRYRTGRPTTPIVGATFVSDNDDYAPVFGTLNSARLPDFHQLDVRLDKRWVFDRWAFTGYVDVQNAYNRKNTTQLVYSYDYSQRAKAPSLPLLAIVGIRADF